MLSKEALVIGATCRALLIGLNPIDSWLRHRLQGMAQGDTDGGRSGSKASLPTFSSPACHGKRMKNARSYATVDWTHDGHVTFCKSSERKT